MHSCELITNLRPKKVLCHRVEVVKNFRCCTTDCVFCNVIGGCKIVRQKQSTLMKPEGSAGCHQTLSSRVGSGHETSVGHVLLHFQYVRCRSFGVVICDKNVCIRLVKGLHEPYQALLSAYMSNGTAGEHR